jgi:predicted nuclease of predicted toxin-antitoxin system
MPPGAWRKWSYLFPRTAHDHVVFTHDLDFGAILAASKAEGPSVLQVRAQDVSPSHLGDLVLSVLTQFRDELARGAVLSMNEKSARVRLLPLK